MSVTVLCRTLRWVMSHTPVVFQREVDPVLTSICKCDLELLSSSERSPLEVGQVMNLRGPTGKLGSL